MPVLEKGATAPDFELTDLNGKTHSLDDLKPGDLLLAVFYHRDCPICQFSMPFVGNIARAVRSERSKVWGISQDDAHDSLEFARDKGLEMPVLVDAAPYPVSGAYGLTNVPTLLLIDSQRRVIDQCVGFSSEDFLRIAHTLADNAGIAPPDVFGGQEVPAMAFG
jgi:peroxiredoxin